MEIPIIVPANFENYSTDDKQHFLQPYLRTLKHHYDLVGQNLAGVTNFSDVLELHGECIEIKRIINKFGIRSPEWLVDVFKNVRTLMNLLQVWHGDESLVMNGGYKRKSKQRSTKRKRKYITRLTRNRK